VMKRDVHLLEMQQYSRLLQQPGEPSHILACRPGMPHAMVCAHLNSDGSGIQRTLRSVPSIKCIMQYNNIPILYAK
jgi:hypothetical protein